MAASGGHWTKITAGHLEGKRMFVPQNWDYQSAYYAYNNGVTPGTMTPEMKVKYFGDANFGKSNTPAAEPAKKPAAEPISAPAKVSTGVDMFGNAMPVTKAPAGKISKAASKSLDPINKMAAASGSKKFDVINQDTVKLKTEVFKPMKTPKKEYGAWKLAADAAIRVSVYHGQPTFVHAVEGKQFTFAVKFANKFDVNLIPAGSKFTLFAAKPSGSATFETVVTNYQG